MYRYGASPNSVAWFQSYLEGWRQFLKLGHIPSRLKPVRQGVLQGSILGPFLFLLFVNDMPLHLNNSTIDIHADDTTLSLSANWNNITSLTKALSNDLIGQYWEMVNWKLNCTSMPRRPKHSLLRENGYNMSFMWKQQAYNYTLMPQISSKYCITSYWV